MYRLFQILRRHLDSDTLLALHDRVGPAHQADEEAVTLLRPLIGPATDEMGPPDRHDLSPSQSAAIACQVVKDFGLLGFIPGLLTEGYAARRGLVLCLLSEHLLAKCPKIVPRDLSDLTEALELSRDALTQVDSADVLRSLGEHLDEIISLLPALRAAPVSSPDDRETRIKLLECLKLFLTTRFDTSEKYEDLSKAIEIGRDILELRPPDHPGRGEDSESLALLLARRFTIEDDLNDAAEADWLMDEVYPEADSAHPPTPEITSQSDPSDWLVQRTRALVLRGGSQTEPQTGSKRPRSPVADERRTRPRTDLQPSFTSNQVITSNSMTTSQAPEAQPPVLLVDAGVPFIPSAHSRSSGAPTTAPLQLFPTTTSTTTGLGVNTWKVDARLQGEMAVASQGFAEDKLAVAMEGYANLWSTTDEAHNYATLHSVVMRFPPTNPFRQASAPLPQHNVPLSSDITIFTFDHASRARDFILSWTQRPNEFIPLVAVPVHDPNNRHNEPSLGDLSYTVASDASSSS